ncbi:Uncharacterized protein Adt_33608 [Abeliophyllum distichum]|uniref:Uncharacterized protein n=1 Tax=Abeliophyllum distichum TaxID=126358 RepID=A0ABD1QWP9_9LAMI
MTASYSASLLVTGNSKRSEYSSSSASRERIMTPALEPSLLDDPSTYIIQVALSSMGGALGRVSSAIKSAKTYAFIAVRGLKSISNSLSSIAHFKRCPDVSGLCSICLSGWSVSICI